MLKQTHSPMTQKTLQLPTDYSTWFQNNQDVEQLVLVGNLQFSELKNFETLLYNTHISTLDITNFSIENAENVDSFYELLSTLYDYSFDKMKWSPFQKIYANKYYVTHFLIDSDWSIITSLDKKVLVHIAHLSFSINEGTEIIGNFAFTNENFNSIILPNTLKKIGIGVFAHSDLKEIKIPDEVNEIGDSAFCFTKIKNITIPPKLSIIPSYCFAFSNLTHIQWGNIKRIEEEAFLCCTLDDVVLPEGVEDIEFNAFCSLSKITLPSTIKNIDKYFYYEYQIDNPADVPFIEVHPDNPYFYSKDGTLYKRGETEPYLGYVYKSDSED